MKRVKYYLSFRFLESALYFLKEASNYEGRENEPNDYYNYILPSGIISIVTFLEGYINEFYSEIADSEKNPTSILMLNNVNVIINLWKRNIPRTARFSILDKYEILLEIAKQNNLDKSKYPYQDVSALIKLRNTLIHYEPEWQYVFENDGKSSLKKLLNGKYKLCPYYDRNEEPFFPNLCLSSDCLQWSINSSIALVSNFNNNLNCVAPLIETFKRTLIKLNINTA